VALISIQPQDRRSSVSKGTRRNGIGEAPGTLHLAASFGCSGFQTGPLFAETGTSYSAARIGQIRSGAEQIA